MRLVISGLVLGLSAVSYAQPSGSPPPAPTGDPVDPNAAPPGPYGQPPQPYGQPYQPYGQPYQQPPPPPPQSLHNGLTFEANLGFGWVHLSTDSDSDTSDLGVAGLSLGVGGWVSPQLAITARVAGVTLSENDARLTNGFLGPSAQYWLQDRFWLGAGAGLAFLSVSDNYNGDSIRGFGLDLRAGVTFTSGSENTFNASLEINPGFYSENGSSATFTSIGFLVGYQHL
jgi:hypothetical protein